MSADDDDLHPKTGHAIRVSYAMYRAFHAAMDKAVGDGAAPADFELVSDEMLRLLRSWGIEVVELWDRPNFPAPPSEPGWPNDEGND